MTAEVIASSPGRVCFAGESLDWMIAGPSIVGAIDLRTTAKVITRDVPDILIRSTEPFYIEKRIPLDQIGKYDDHPLDYIQAAIKVLADYGIPIRPFLIETMTFLPTKAGVSSSAAITIASIAAISQIFDRDMTAVEVSSYAFKVEDQELRTGAGQMDFFACGLGGLQYLNCSTQPPYIERYPSPNTSLILVDTLEQHSTKKFVSSKRERFQDGEPLIMSYVQEAPKIVEKMRLLLASFEENTEEIGELITLYHNYLRDFVQCSTDLLDAAVKICLKNGAYGAKLTGSGMGGCMFALSPNDKTDQIVTALSDLPVKIYKTIITERGVEVITY